MKTFDVSHAPHLPPRRSVRAVMGWVLLALSPGVIANAVCFGSGPLIQIALAVCFALAFEALMLRLREQPLRPFLTDLSAPLAGVLFALCLPPLAPWWIAAIGMFMAMVFAKHVYGGLGYNLFNPAMVGYAVVLICFPLELSRWPQAFDASNVGVLDSLQAIFRGVPPPPAWDAVAQATPLDVLRQASSSGQTVSETLASPAYQQSGTGAWLWIALAYAAGGSGLLMLRIIAWQTPLALIGTVMLVSLPLHVFDSDLFLSPLVQLSTGGLMLAAFFIATDPVTGCTTTRGRWIFAIGVALLTLTIRRWGAYPDGVAFAILLMNCAAPWIDLHTRPRIFGEGSSRP